MTTQDIINRVQSELEDATGTSNDSWTDPDYILGKLVVVGDDIAVRLELLDLNYDTQEIILPNIPANTTDLSIYQASGQPLAQMIVCKSVEWRLVGENQQQWEFVGQVDKLIDTDMGTGEAGAAIESDDVTVESWTFMGGKLGISPCEQPVDLRVRFVATALQLSNNSVQQIVGLTNVYVYKTCEKICASRAVGTSALVTYFRSCFDRACADFEALSTKTQQSKMIRIGGRRSMSSTGWNNGGGGFTPPIVG